MRTLTTSGLVTTIAGGGSQGGTALGRADGFAFNALFAFPYGVAASSGVVFIAG